MGFKILLKIGHAEVTLKELCLKKYTDLNEKNNQKNEILKLFEEKKFGKLSTKFLHRIQKVFKSYE